MTNLEKYTEAKEIYHKILIIRHKVFGPMHPDTQEAKKNYALALKDLGKEQEGNLVLKSWIG